MEKSIYELKLNEKLVINDNMATNNGQKTEVTRVSGGWVYTTTVYVDRNPNNSLGSSSVFVPYNNEFDNNTYKGNR